MLGFNEIDILFVIVILFFAVSGYRKGLIVSVGGVLSIVLGIYCAITFWPAIGDYLQENYALVSILAGAMERVLPVPAFDQMEKMVPLLFETATYAYRGLAYHMARLLVSALSFVLIFMLVLFVTRMIWRLLSAVFNWGILGTANRMGGLGFESAKAILILSIVVGLAAPILKTIAQTGVQSAVIANGFYRESCLAPWLEQIFQLMGRLISG